MKLPSPAIVATWPPPNYDNPPTRGSSLVILNGVLLALATVAVALRIYTRCFVRKWFGLDDIFICLAYICSVALNAIVAIGSTTFGWDRHEWDIPLAMTSDSLKLAFWAKIIFLLTAVCAAFSLLAFYYRLISESASHWFRWILHAAVVFNIVTWLPFLFTQIFICVPVSAYWSFPETAGARCIDEGKVTFAGGIVKTVVDLVITTLPIPLILRTKMQRRQRYGVAVLFALGYTVTAAGAIRAYFSWKVFHNPRGDMSWEQYPAFLAASVENNLAIVCACTPTIRPLFPHFFDGPISRIRGWLSSNKSDSTYPSTDESKQPAEDEPPRRSRHISQLGSSMRFSRIQHTRSLSDCDDYESDIKLVIQKHEDAHRAIELDGMAVRGATTKSSTDLDRKRSLASIITIGNTDMNPFDPRWDGKHSQGLH